MAYNLELQSCKDKADCTVPLAALKWATWRKKALLQESWITPKKYNT